MKLWPTAGQQLRGCWLTKSIVLTGLFLSCRVPRSGMHRSAAQLHQSSHCMLRDATGQSTTPKDPVSLDIPPGEPTFLLDGIGPTLWPFVHHQKFCDMQAVASLQYDTSRLKFNLAPRMVHICLHHPRTGRHLHSTDKLMILLWLTCIRGLTRISC